MKKQKLRELAPPGANLRQTLVFCAGIAVAAVLLASFFPFLISYGNARSQLYELRYGVRVLRSNAAMLPLEALLCRSFAPYFGAVAAYLLMIAANYASFFRPSRSIYLMRRIPSRWELLKRCLSLPFFAIFVCFCFAGVLICLCNLIYFRATPEVCIPAGVRFTFWRAF